MIQRIAAMMLLVSGLLMRVALSEEPLEPTCPKPEVRLMTLDPGHFHAALVLKEGYQDLSSRVDVYAPLGPDLLAYLERIRRFNERRQNPTAWQLEVHAGPDSLERMLGERPGNVVVIAGRNRGKILAIQAALEAGLSVLADKPWIIQAKDLPTLAAVLDQADRRGLVAYDVMTERHEITTILQRELIADESVFGKIVAGDAVEPGVQMESVHCLMKLVDGAPNVRPAWFFDVDQQGEGLADVGTHLVDLAQWMLFPGRSVEYRTDIQVLDARRWPTSITREDFRKVTATNDYPELLAKNVRDGALEYFCNGRVHYAIRGIHVVVSVVWDWEAPPGAGDRHFARIRGSRSRIEVRQGEPEGFRPELYVIPNRSQDKARVVAALRKRLGRLGNAYPDLSLEERDTEIRITIPEALRGDHESRFALVTKSFLSYVRDRTALPAWERANMLAKYYVTTRATAISRDSPSEAPERLAP